MAITFSVNHENGYFISKYIGKVTAEEIIDSYTKYFNSKEWSHELNELVDHSDLDGSMLSVDSMTNVAIFSESFYKKQNISIVKTAIYAPNDLSFGLSRMYDALVDDSPEKVAVFRELEKAKLWLSE